LAYRSFIHRFGQRVRTLRLERGLSQEALADAARLHRTHISLIERGQRSVRLETIAAVAAALGVQPSELMPRLDGRRD
jgi:transcriptional regulator with XRE-family HTH domain